MEIEIYKTKEETAKAFSGYLAKRIAASTSFHISLSGGSTPKLVFDLLASSYKDKIDWSKVHLYWGDERCVPPTDSESNYGMTKNHLISKVEIPEDQIYRIKGEDLPAMEAERYSSLMAKNLVSVNSIPQFDLVILGLGDDGHTASIFPHQIYLWNAKENCTVALHPKSNQKRISITGKIINNADEVVFLVTGKNKASKVAEIIRKRGNYLDYPANLVNPASDKLTWFMDKDAAMGL
ncbi:MAG: 6-phosphogluconolactonase [Eudoraea sp.]|uniref:6-phosphogluconolactonase n=1 Tax=Eudoraea sp. TaxID=1979955 RepID=UPI003C7168AB